MRRIVFHLQNIRNSNSLLHIDSTILHSLVNSYFGFLSIAQFVWYSTLIGVIIRRIC